MIRTSEKHLMIGDLFPELGLRHRKLAFDKSGSVTEQRTTTMIKLRIVIVKGPRQNLQADER